MKQITIKTLRNNVLISKKHYFTNNCNSILIDTIYDYINTLNVVNFLHGIKLDYVIEVNNVNIINEVYLFHHFKSKIDKNQEQINKQKQRLKVLEKLSQHEMLKQWL